jgi:signal transduction histidine kinase
MFFLEVCLLAILDGINNEELRKKRIIQVTWLAQIAVILASFNPILVQDWFNLTLLTIFVIAFSLCRFLAKKGRLNLSANLVSISLTIMILVFCWFNEGVRDEILLVFPALITFAVLTGTDKFLWGVYALISCNLMFMGLLNELELVQHETSGAGMISAITIIIILSVVTYSIRILGSDLRLANHKLREHKEELEREVEVRTNVLQQSLEDLTSAKNQLVEAEKMASLGRLVAGVAHEINTPLGIAVTASSLINEGTLELKSTLDKNEVTKSGLTSYVNETEQSIIMIQGNLKRAANLISDFKQAAVLQSDERVKTFNLYEMLLSVIEQNQAVSTGVTAQVLGDKAVFIKQDPDVITRIFTNLYTNSCIHGFSSQEEGNVKIEISQSGESVTILYSDDGRGVEKENIEHIFEPFFTTKRGKGGTGLGMHIVYNLVTQSLKGRINYKEGYCKGACFEISFQLA